MNPKVVFACLVSALLGALIGVGVLKAIENNKGERVVIVEANEGTKAGSKTSPVMSKGIDLTNPSITFGDLYRLGEQHAFNNPREAVAKASQISGIENRDIYLEQVYTTWGKREGKEAALWAMENLKGHSKSDALYYIADGWAEADPVAAAKWFTYNTSGAILKDSMRTILEAWGRKDPHAAFEWTDFLDEFTQRAVMDGLAEGWGAIDPKSAAEAGKALQDREYGEDFIITVMMQWAARRPQEAAEWVKTVQEDGLKAITYMELGAEWANADPEAAAKWVNEVEDAEAQKIAKMGIAMGWSEHDPGGAMDWAIESMTDRVDAEQVIEETMLTWTNSDPNDAARWLNARKEGPQTDSILTIFSGAIIDQDPISAVKWANEISNQEKRDSHLRELLNEWLAMDGEEARAEIRGMALPANLKKEFGNAH